MHKIVVAALVTALGLGIAHADVARENGDNRPAARRLMMGNAVPSAYKAPESIEQRGTTAQG